jgi:hypothetical protein
MSDNLIWERMGVEGRGSHPLSLCCLGPSPKGPRPTTSRKKEQEMKIIIDTEMKESMEFVREDGTVQPWKKYTVQVDGMEITIVMERIPESSVDMIHHQDSPLSDPSTTKKYLTITEEIAIMGKPYLTTCPKNRKHCIILIRF